MDVSDTECLSAVVELLIPETDKRIEAAVAKAYNVSLVGVEGGRALDVRGEVYRGALLIVKVLW
jgi:hypothetical protein